MCCLVARGFQLKREQMYQQSPTVAFAQYANENQVISTQCITRQCSRLAGGKMITLHNDSLLLCIASGKTTLIFCLTCAVFQRMCQSLHENASSWLQTWLTFWVLSLCGKHEIKSCLTWQGEWVFVVPSCQFHCFEGFCPLWLCVLRSGLVLAWLKWRLWRLDFLCNLSESGPILKFSLRHEGIHSPHTVYLPSGWTALITLGFRRCWNCGAY